MALTLARKGEFDSISQLNGTQKAAILYMVLGAESAAKITQKLSPEDVESISFEIARTKTYDPCNSKLSHHHFWLSDEQS